MDSNNGLSSPNKPLKLIGQRVLIGLDQLPFMHYLSPLALVLATFREPRGTIFPKKIFIYLKSALIEKTFKRRSIKNYQKTKVLIKGFEAMHQSNTIESQQLSSSNSKTLKRKMKKINRENLQKWFESLTEKQHEDFVPSIAKVVQRCKERDFRSALRLRRAIIKIIERQKSQQLQECEQIFEDFIKRVRIPWTQNIYKSIEKHGMKLWEKYRRVKQDTKMEKQEEEEDSFTEKKVSKDKQIKKKNARKKNVEPKVSKKKIGVSIKTNLKPGKQLNLEDSFLNVIGDLNKSEEQDIFYESRQE